MTSNQQTETNPPALAIDDPRYSFAKIVDAVGTLIEATDREMLSNATPCPEFTVKELLGHLVMAVRRVAMLGRGEPWPEVDPPFTDANWAQDYRSAAHEVMLAWTDPAVLEKVISVPWGDLPGAAVMYSYAGELAVHGWDLSQATGLPFEIEDDLLQGAMIAAKFIPTEGRDDPDMPFAPIVDPGPDASVLDQVAGWMGRNVLA